MSRHSALTAGAALLGALLLAALLADALFTDDPMALAGRPGLWPFADPRFPLGTDHLGRDIAAQLCHGARVSLLVGFGAAAIAAAIGLAVGVASGYAGGRTDAALMRVCEFFQTIPSFLFAMVLIIVLEPSLTSIVVAIGVTSWPQIARLARGEVLRVRGADYVLAAVTMGVGTARIVATHVLPNSVSPVVVAASALVAQAILVEASLAFLGLGDPSVVSWGGMIGDARPMLRTAWYMAALPGVAIFAAVMAVTLIGNGLNDALNPRGRARPRPEPL